MKTLRIPLILLALSLLILGGCEYDIKDAIKDMVDYEDTLEDLTSQEVSHVTNMFNGAVGSRDYEVVLAENFEISTSQKGYTRKADASRFSDHLRLMEEGIGPAGFSVSGHVINYSFIEVTLALYLAPGDDPLDETRRVYLATVMVPPGGDIDFAPGSQMVESAAQVEANILDFFTVNPDADKLALWAEPEAEDQVTVNILEAVFSATPLYAAFTLIDGDPISDYPDQIESIDEVRLEGRVANRGHDAIRIMLVFGEQAMGPDFNLGVVADGILEPGQAADIEDLMTQGAAEQVTQVVTEAFYGDATEAHIILLGASDLDGVVSAMSIKSKLTMGIE